MTETLANGLDELPRMWWKPEDDQGPECLIIETVGGPKTYRREWHFGTPVWFTEWGWVLPDTAIPVRLQPEPAAVEPVGVQLAREGLAEMHARMAAEPVGVSDAAAAPTRLANRKGLRVGELIEFLQTQDPDAPVAAECGCGPSGWSAPATDAHADSFTAVNVGACVKIGWGDFE